MLHSAVSLLTRASLRLAAYTLAMSHSCGRISCGVKFGACTVLNHEYSTRHAVSLAVFGFRMPSTTYMYTFPALPGYSCSQ